MDWAIILPTHYDPYTEATIFKPRNTMALQNWYEFLMSGCHLDGTFLTALKPLTWNLFFGMCTKRLVPE